MNLQLVEWWIKSIQATLNTHKPKQWESPWATTSVYQQFFGFNRILSQLWSLWPAQPNNPQSTINWSFIEGAILQSQQLYLKWITMAMPLPLEKLENRIASLEEQAMSQGQLVDQLCSQISQGNAQIPETVSALQQLIDKQGREFHRLTDRFKTYVKENIDPTASKK